MSKLKNSQLLLNVIDNETLQENEDIIALMKRLLSKPRARRTKVETSGKRSISHQWFKSLEELHAEEQKLGQKLCHYVGSRGKVKDQFCGGGPVVNPDASDEKLYRCSLCETKGKGKVGKSGKKAVSAQTPQRLITSGIARSMYVPPLTFREMKITPEKFKIASSGSIAGLVFDTGRNPIVCVGKIESALLDELEADDEFNITADVISPLDSTEKAVVKNHFKSDYVPFNEEDDDDTPESPPPTIKKSVKRTTESDDESEESSSESDNSDDGESQEDSDEEPPKRKGKKAPVRKSRK